MNIISSTARIVNEQAFRIGSLDAQLGDVACPELYYRNAHDKADYCLGYESVIGPTLTTTQFLGASNGR